MFRTAAVFVGGLDADCFLLQQKAAAWEGLKHQFEAGSHQSGSLREVLF